jgi:hypothetical protein
MNLNEDYIKAILEAALRKRPTDEEVERASEAAEGLPVAASYWTVDDIDQVLHDMRRRSNALTHDEKRYILHGLETNYDANYGITWETVGDAVDDKIEEEFR